MNYKVGDRVNHKLIGRLANGRIVAILAKHDNPEHDKPGPWYRIDWSEDPNPSFTAGRLFHGDVLEDA